MKDNTYKASCFLVIGMNVQLNSFSELRAAGKPSFRTAVKKPSTAKNEIAIKLDIDLPLALFTRPELTASIVVPPEKQPYQIDADVQHRIAESVRESTGLDVRISVEPPQA